MKHSTGKIPSAKRARYKGFSRLELLLLGGAGTLCCVFLWPALAQNAVPIAPEPGQEGPLTEAQKAQQCQTNLKQMGLALLQYTQDYDEKFPPAVVRYPQSGDDEVTPVGWGDAILPYARSFKILQCPAEGHVSSVTRVQAGKISDAAQLSGFTDYWFNINVAGVSLAQVQEVSRTLSFGEGDGGAINSNARYTLDELPPDWIKNPRSPAHRHSDGEKGNYAFLDGHVVALAPSSIVDKPAHQVQPGEATFDEGMD